jgi:hypothetical protein
MEYLVTFYLANKGESKEIFSILPYEAAAFTGSEDEVLVGSRCYPEIHEQK